MKQNHPILLKPISALATSIAFQEMCGMNKFYNLADILELKVHVLMKKPGITSHLLMEFVEIVKEYKLEGMLKEEFE